MITEIEWSRALSLARGYGHGWARWADGVDLLHLRAEAAADAAVHARGGDEDAWTAWSPVHDAVIAEGPVPVARPSSWREAEKRFAAEGRPGPMGLGVEPTPDHRTGTGRLSWEVRPDGHASLVVSRPSTVCCPPRRQGDRCFCAGVAVLCGDVSPEGEVTVVEEGPALERHWDCLCHALLCVATPEAVRAASPILAVLMDAEDT